MRLWRLLKVSSRQIRNSVISYGWMSSTCSVSFGPTTSAWGGYCPCEDLVLNWLCLLGQRHPLVLPLCNLSSSIGRLRNLLPEVLSCSNHARDTLAD